MLEKKEIYTGLYLLGEADKNTSFGGVSGRIKLPTYTKEIMLFINDKCKHKTEHINNQTTYSFTIAELKGMYEALGRILNDTRKLEALSKQNLLREEAYS